MEVVAQPRSNYGTILDRNIQALNTHPIAKTRRRLSCLGVLFFCSSSPNNQACLFQVHKHQTSRGSARGHHSTSARQPLPAVAAQASQGASRGSIRKDTVAPEQSYEQASNWVQPGEGRGAPGAAGQSRGRKKRLAANFQPE